ncbi:MAG: hypothetical protein IPP58_14025 [Holophagaceae bacterium]|uniref:Yip1 domain-containing protein n=1 Tax=Candidatus Geothrix skivensis TaxID=2954439 RepID=A0A9D7XJD3_9BACT|nr:hypothetical protein [Candidatus Geothrix skivensis]
MEWPFAAAFRALRSPREAFAAPPPGLGRAVLDMALVWVPLALLNATWSAIRGLRVYESLRGGALPVHVLQWLRLDPGNLQELVAALPAPPTFGRLWPWLILLVPLGALGTWLHHAVWDHMGLWLLGGLRAESGFRTTLLAEAQALRFAAVGTLVGLLGFLPGLGVWLVLPLLLLDAYLWMFRGFALAARHGCEPWQGLGATAVHAALLGCGFLGLLALLFAMIRVAP